MADLTVATLNTWKGGGDYAARLTSMARGLHAVEPDIVLLQEVFVALQAHADTGSALAHALGLHHVHHPARIKKRSFLGEAVLSTSGLSILSRWPINALRVVNLPEWPRDGERLAQMGTVAAPWFPFTVINLHLTHFADATSVRCRQMETIIATLRRWQGGMPAIIGGDFNAEPDDEPLTLLRSAPGLAVKSAWEAAGGPQPTQFPRDPQAGEGRCVDHLFIVQELAGQHRLEFARTMRVLDQPDPRSGQFASDHFGIVARVQSRW